MSVEIINALDYIPSISLIRAQSLHKSARIDSDDTNTYLWSPVLSPFLEKLLDPASAAADTVLELHESDPVYPPPLLDSVGLRVVVPPTHRTYDGSLHVDSRHRWLLWAPDSQLYEEHRLEAASTSLSHGSLARVWGSLSAPRSIPRDLAVHLLKKSAGTVSYRGSKKHLNPWLLYLCMQIPDLAPGLLSSGAIELEILPLFYDDATDAEISAAIRYVALSAGARGRRSLTNIKRWIKPIRFSAIKSSRYKQLPDTLLALGSRAISRLVGRERDAYAGWLFKYPDLDHKIQQYLPDPAPVHSYYDTQLIRIGIQYLCKGYDPNLRWDKKYLADWFATIASGGTPPPTSFVEACGRIPAKEVALHTSNYLLSKLL